MVHATRLEVPLHEPVRVCLLMYVGVAQGNTPSYRPGEIHIVPTARQVTDECLSHDMSWPLTQSSRSVYVSYYRIDVLV
jgi:hypothetical protein